MIDGNAAPLLLLLLAVLVLLLRLFTAAAPFLA